jgi:hypothetical protein
VTDAASNGKSKFFADVPSEIRELDWYEARAVRGAPPPTVTEFATKFLNGVVEDTRSSPTRCFTSRGSSAGFDPSSENPENTAVAQLGTRLTSNEPAPT